MFQCKNCFEYKEPTAFPVDRSKTRGHKPTCRACCSVRYKELSYRKDLAAPLQLQRAEKYLIQLFRRACKEETVNIPVKRMNNFMAIPQGCVVKTIEGRKRVIIANEHGPIDYPFATLNPKALLKILEDLEIKVLLPGEAQELLK